MEEHILDLTKRQWSASRYGLTVIGTWVKIDQRWRPCMAVVKNDARQLLPCVIPLEKAWTWSETLGDPDTHAYNILLRLGVDPENPLNRNKLISLVNDNMQALIEMPPRPVDAEHHAAPVAEVTINNEVAGRTEVAL